MSKRAPKLQNSKPSKTIRKKKKKFTERQKKVLLDNYHSSSEGEGHEDIRSKSAHSTQKRKEQTTAKGDDSQERIATIDDRFLQKKEKRKENDEQDSNDDQGEDDDELEQTNEVHSTFENPGWADVLAKILAKNPQLEINQSSVVMAKATPDFELVEKPSLKTKTQKQRQDWENLCRHKPHHNEKESERRFALIATKGVVQLFNTIRQQKLERKRK